ncbi:MAG: hypothetical protein QOJ54_2275, partial [Aliidongia sp.]|nr:hypothetical protein [Aliidongia sp.]
MLNLDLPSAHLPAKIALSMFLICGVA